MIEDASSWQSFYIAGTYVRYKRFAGV